MRGLASRSCGYLIDFIDQEYLIGEDKVLNPKKYFIVTLALFSNGEVGPPPAVPWELTDQLTVIFTLEHGAVTIYGHLRY